MTNPAGDLAALLCIDRLNYIAVAVADSEKAGFCAERDLMEFLRAAGYGDVADAYENCRDTVGFYYA